jgi:hypothetical protein
VDVGASPHDPAEGGHRVGREVDEEVLLERRLKQQRIERAARHELACGARQVDTGAGERVDVDMMETALA